MTDVRIDRLPVTDWATDYDIFDSGYVTDPYGIWDALRSACPIAHSERWGGSWLPTTYADVTELARDIERFPSGNGVAVVPPPADGSRSAHGARQLLTRRPVSSERVLRRI